MSPEDTGPEKKGEPSSERPSFDEIVWICDACKNKFQFIPYDDLEDDRPPFCPYCGRPSKAAEDRRSRNDQKDSTTFSKAIVKFTISTGGGKT